MGEDLEQDGRGESPHQRHGEFQVHEPLGQASLDELGQVRTQAHGAEVDADDRGELEHRITQQVAGQGARHQLIHEPAGGDQENTQEEKRSVEGCAFRPAGIRRGGVLITHGWLPR